MQTKFRFRKTVFIAAVSLAFAGRAPAEETAPPVATPPKFIPAGPPDSGGMITIPAGEFLSGDDRKPVTLPAYRIDKTEVTVASYAKCVEAGACAKPANTGNEDNWDKSSRDDHPMNDVNWGEAKTYCEWAGKRLPTGLEWEKAARGTDGRPYPWGNEAPACDRAILKGVTNDGCDMVRTWRVCSRLSGKSPYGLCDMAGNVSEWTDSWYDHGKLERDIRGGSWSSDAEDLTIVPRRTPHPGEADRKTTFGFRCVQDAPPEKESAKAAVPHPDDMVLIPAGEFLSGCIAKLDPACALPQIQKVEKPEQKILLPAYRIDRTEVTVADYAKCVDAGVCAKPDSARDIDNWGKPDRLNHPVNSVNADDAEAFCEWAGKRLPTGYEWEKAARGTDGRTYPWGETEVGKGGKVANGADLSSKKKYSPRTVIIFDYDDGYIETAPVCSFPAGNSPYGLCDMAGNVWEWTSDVADYNHRDRVLRGGSWTSQVRDVSRLRISYLGVDYPAHRLYDDGFRCVQDVK